MSLERLQHLIRQQKQRGALQRLPPYTKNEDLLRVMSLEGKAHYTMGEILYPHGQKVTEEALWIPNEALYDIHATSLYLSKPSKWQGDDQQGMPVGLYLGLFRSELKTKQRLEQAPLDVYAYSSYLLTPEAITSIIQSDKHTRNFIEKYGWGDTEERDAVMEMLAQECEASYWNNMTAKDHARLRLILEERGWLTDLMTLMEKHDITIS